MPTLWGIGPGAGHEIALEGRRQDGQVGVEQELVGLGAAMLILAQNL